MYLALGGHWSVWWEGVQWNVNTEEEDTDKGDKDIDDSPRHLALNGWRHIGREPFFFNMKDPGEVKIEDKYDQRVIN